MNRSLGTLNQDRSDKNPDNWLVLSGLKRWTSGKKAITYKKAAVKLMGEIVDTLGPLADEGAQCAHRRRQRRAISTETSSTP